jgi:hypothetical protein
LVDQANVDALNEHILEVPDYFPSLPVGPTERVGEFEFAVVRNLFDKEPLGLPLYNVVGNAPLYSDCQLLGRQYFVNTTFKF